MSEEHPTAKQAHRIGTWDRWRDEQGMVRCHMRNLAECRGRLQAAHYISAQRLTIKRRNAAIAAGGRGFYRPPETEAILAATVDELTADSRNSLVLCEFHHGRFDRLGLHILAPECVQSFARDYGLEHLLIDTPTEEEAA